MPTKCSVKNCKFYGVGGTMSQIPIPCPQSWLQAIARDDGENNIKNHKILLGLFFVNDVCPPPPPPMSVMQKNQITIKFTSVLICLENLRKPCSTQSIYLSILPI